MKPETQVSDVAERLRDLLIKSRQVMIVDHELAIPFLEGQINRALSKDTK
jgi:hypothetical protein